MMSPSRRPVPAAPQPFTINPAGCSLVAATGAACGRIPPRTAAETAARRTRIPRRAGDRAGLLRGTVGPARSPVASRAGSVPAGSSGKASCSGTLLDGEGSRHHATNEAACAAPFATADAASSAAVRASSQALRAGTTAEPSRSTRRHDTRLGVADDGQVDKGCASAHAPSAQQQREDARGTDQPRRERAHASVVQQRGASGPDQQDGARDEE